MIICDLCGELTALHYPDGDGNEVCTYCFALIQRAKKEAEDLEKEQRDNAPPEIQKPNRSMYKGEK